MNLSTRAIWRVSKAKNHSFVGVFPCPYSLAILPACEFARGKLVQPLAATSFTTFCLCPTGLVPVDTRFDTYPRTCSVAVGRAGSVTSIVATPRPKLAADRLGLVWPPIY